MVTPHTSIKIHKVKSTENKGDQHYEMVWDCIYYCGMVNNANYPSYNDVMNVETRSWNHEEECFVTLTYHLNLNKW